MMSGLEPLAGPRLMGGILSLGMRNSVRMCGIYIDHQSFWLDLRILLITIWKVMRRDGISAAGEATMMPFH